MKFLYAICIHIVVFVSLSSCGVSKSINHLPNLENYNQNVSNRKIINDSTFILDNNFLLKNAQGQWEMYLEGNPYELGQIAGSLSRELMHKQEAAFFDKVKNLIPSRSQQFMLRKFLAWYNRKMYLHIPEQYQTELYAMSRFSGDGYNFIADKYLRLLYLHGAHDIGHAMQDLMLVGCSSFAVWDNKTEDGELLIARNFDFYVGDDFAEEKVISFINPTEGHKFMSVSWPGMIGVVSGMNKQGLTVTINAGKSKIPLVAKTPISIVAREILQYASTIEEAISIAKKREVFVSEAILIGSAKDRTAAIIEISPGNFDVVLAENTEQLICSNHFQSDAYQNDARHLDWIKESHSLDRFNRMDDLISKENKLDVQDAVDILRDKNGSQDQEIGYGNEKSLNQLLAHHGVVFKPESLEVWVSSNPYQLGEFVYYDLNEVFKNRGILNLQSISESELNIPSDIFLESKEYKDYERYRELEKKAKIAIANKTHLNPKLLTELQARNPEYWRAYFLTGKYYYQNKYNAAALIAFEKALTKKIPSATEKRNIEKYIKKLKWKTAK